MVDLRVQFLGGFSLWLQQRQLALDDWPTQKSLSFFKILLLERGQWVSSDQMVEYLWPDLPLTKARNNLWVTASQVRRVLEPGLNKGVESRFIHQSPNGYRLNPDVPVWVDIHAFETAVQTALERTSATDRLGALEKARALYTGAFLPENLYDDWAEKTRRQVENRYLMLLLEMTESYAAKGEYQNAIDAARESVDLDPTREDAYRRMMQYHAQLDQIPQALKVFEECKQVLFESLGVSVSSETDALARQLIRRAEAPLAFPGAVPPPQHISPSQPDSPFVGREDEYARLTALVNQLVTHRGQAAFIEGEPGIGKSRLVAEVIRFAQQRRITAIQAGCYQIEQTTPFQPVIALVEQILQTDLIHAVKDLPPVYLAEIAALVPELSLRFPQIPQLPTGLDETRLARLFKALSLFFTSLSLENPLIMVLDDIHWADQATLKLLHYLIRAITPHSILLINTIRTEEMLADQNLAAYFQEIRRQAHVHWITLAHLEQADIVALLEAKGSLPRDRIPQLAEWLHLETEGNPFFLVTILQSLQGDDLLQVTPKNINLSPSSPAGLSPTLPEALREYVRVLLRRISKPARSVLDAAAVLHHRFEFSTLQAVTQIQPRELLGILVELSVHHLLHELEDGRHFDFHHDKIREVVYHDLTQTHRIYLHNEIAQYLEKSKADTIAEYAGTLAEHFEQARVWPKTILYLAKAGHRSRSLFILADAIRFFDHALELTNIFPSAVEPGFEIQLHEWRGETAMQAGAFADALKDLEIALNAARMSEDREKERSLLISLGMVYRRSDQGVLSRACLEKALEISRVCDDERAVADALYHLGTVVWSQGDNKSAWDYHQEAVEISRRLGLRDLVAAQAIHGLGESAWFSAQYRLAVQYFTESLELSRQLGDKGLEDENLHNLGAMHTGMLGADYPLAVQELEMALEITREGMLNWHIMPSLFILSLAKAGLGDYQTALEYSRQAIDTSQQLKSFRYATVAHDFAGLLLQDLNLHQAAEEMHASGLEIARSNGIGFWLPRLQANLAIDRLNQGQMDVEKDLLQALDTCQKNRLELHISRCLEGLAQWSLASGQPRAAIDHAGRLLEIAQSQGLREIKAQALRWSALARLALGDLQTAAFELGEAMDLGRMIGKPRLLWDLHAAFILLYQDEGDVDRLKHHQAAVSAIISTLRRNLTDPLYQAGLPIDLP